MTRWAYWPAATIVCPCLMLAMVRLNVPSFTCMVVSILPGPASGQGCDDLRTLFERGSAPTLSATSPTRNCTSWHAPPVRRGPAPAAAGFTSPRLLPASPSRSAWLRPLGRAAPAPYDSRDAYAEASWQRGGVIELPSSRNILPARPRHP